MASDSACVFYKSHLGENGHWSTLLQGFPFSYSDKDCLLAQQIIKPKDMGLLVENPVYKPFRYPWCYDAWLTQQRIHWLPEEVPLGK